jgi:Nickel/cobalt transporter regulator
MATKSVLKSSASALLALMLGTAALIPAAASAQERPDRGERGAGRMERAVPAAAPAQAPRAPVVSAPSGWQGRAPVMAAPSGWQNRPAVSSNPSGWQGRPAWQGGGERGDRGNGANPIGQPTYGRPAWANNGTQGSTPAWQGRNPTYVDPARNQNRNLPAESRGQPSNPQVQSRWYHADNGAWRSDPNRAGSSDADRRGWQGDDNRDRGRDRDHDERWRGNNGWRGDTNNGRGYAWGNNNGWRGNSGGYNNGWRAWDHDSWRRDYRYDWRDWRNRHRSTFSLGYYASPWRDYSYSRLSIGVVIGAPFYSERYWIADPWSYRLPEAWGPYRWVRYYDDALLVDIYSGEVVDVVYDIFY